MSAKIHVALIYAGTRFLLMLLSIRLCAHPGLLLDMTRLVVQALLTGIKSMASLPPFAVAIALTLTAVPRLRDASMDMLKVLHCIYWLLSTSAAPDHTEDL